MNQLGYDERSSVAVGLALLGGMLVLFYAFAVLAFDLLASAVGSLGQ